MDKNTRKLAQVHYLVLAQMAANPVNHLRRLSGGFWVVDPDADEYRVNEWSTGTKAVSAMVKLGLVRYVGSTNKAVELTAMGLEALRTGVYSASGETNG